MALPLILLAIVGFVLLWLGRLAYFRGKYLRSTALLGMYRAYAESGGKGPPGRDTLLQRTAEVHRLWDAAGLEDGSVPYAQPVGMMRVATGHYSARENWTTLNEDVVSYTYQAFHRAIGWYEDWVREARNPLNTLVFILTLPQALVRWLGVGSGEGSLSKLASLVWSLFVVVATVLGFVSALRDLAA